MVMNLTLAADIIAKALPEGKHESLTLRRVEAGLVYFSKFAF